MQTLCQDYHSWITGSPNAANELEIADSVVWELKNAQVMYASFFRSRKLPGKYAELKNWINSFDTGASAGRLGLTLTSCQILCQSDRISSLHARSGGIVIVSMDTRSKKSASSIVANCSSDLLLAQTSSKSDASSASLPTGRKL